MRDDLRYLDQQPGRAGPRRADRRRWWPAPEPLVRLLGQRIGRPGADHGAAAGGADPPLLRQPRRVRRVDRARRRRAAGSSPPSTTGDDGARLTRRSPTAVDIAATLPRRHRRRRRRSPRDVGRTAGWSPTSTSTWADQPDADAMAARLRRAPRPGTRLPDGVRRVTVTVAGTSGAAMHHHFTFRPDGAGFAEDRLIRGLHPLIAERLQLQRLRELRPHPAAVRRRGGLPVQGRRAQTTRPTSGWSRWPRSAT